MNSSSPYQHSNSVVQIFKGNGMYAGTGFLIDNEGGILTTMYIVGKDKDFNVTLTGSQSYNATLEKIDGITELALLRMVGFQQSYLNIVNIDELSEHQKVTIIGCSGNTMSMLEGTAAGTYSSDSLSPKKISIRVNVPPRGLSGSPAINEHGDVIGVLIGYIPQTHNALLVSGKSAFDFLHK